jgi:hypothetical protein
MPFLRGAAKVCFVRSEANSEHTVFLSKTNFPDGSCSRQRQSRLYRSVALLKPFMASSLIYLAHPNAVLAQTRSAQELPPIVIVDPGQKPKPKLAKRVGPKRTVTSRGNGQANPAAQEAGNSGTTTAKCKISINSATTS